MLEAANPSRDNEQTEPGNDPVSYDMSPLIRRVHELCADHERDVAEQTIESFDLDSFAKQTGFAPRRKGKPEIVLSSDVAVELGHPSTSSQAFVLLTNQTGIVRDKRVTRLGPDFDEMPQGEQRPFGQVVMLGLRPDSAPDPFDLEGVQFLINRLPGYMIRSIPGRLWVRVSKQGRRSGLTLTTVAKALFAAFRGDFPEVEAIEILFVTSRSADVDSLAPIALEANVVAGRHKKLVLSPDGELDCAELSCDTCDEQPVCDDLRDILRHRRRDK